MQRAHLLVQIATFSKLVSFSKINTEEQKNTGLNELVLNVLNLVSNFKQRQSLF